MTDRYKKLPKSIPVTTVTLTSVKTVSVDNWTLPYGRPAYSLADNKLQVV